MAETSKKASRKGRAPAPVNETTEQKLVRLASVRVPKALQAIRLVGNLKAYKPTEQQIDNIIKALVSQIEQTRDSLRSGKASKPAFTL